MAQEELLKLEDDSGDRNYFTIIPNYILNHSTAVAQALYLQLKRLAGENGVAYPASRYLREKLGISYNTLKKELDYLLNKGWIKEDGFKEIQTDGGRQKVKCYKIIDLWKLNSDFYQGGVKIGTPNNQRGVKRGTQGVSTRGVKIGTKEEPLEQEPSFKKNSASSGKLKCFYKPTGEQMRFSEGKWWVLPKNGGEWLHWVDKEVTKVCFPT